MLSAPIAPRDKGTRPAACTASTRSSAPAARHRAAASARGCSTPVSLFAAIRQTSAGGPARARAKASRSSRPSAKTGRRSAPGRGGQHRGMFGGAHQHPPPLAQGSNRQGVGLGAAGGEHHTRRFGTEAGRYVAARLLQQAPRRPPRGMHRRGVATEIEGGDRRRPRLRAQGFAGIGIQIQRCGHRPSASSGKGGRAGSSAGGKARPRTRPSTTSARLTAPRNSAICAPSSAHRSCVRQRWPPRQPGPPSKHRVAEIGSSTARTMSAMRMAAAGRASR